MAVAAGERCNQAEKGGADMLEVLRNSEIHDEDGGWVRARWHFSFDHYHDPRWDGVGPQRVFNHDRLAPDAPWPMHPHADSEPSELLLVDVPLRWRPVGVWAR